MESKKTSYSLRKILAVMLAVLFPVALGGIFFILYTIRDTQEREHEALCASIRTQTAQVSTELSRMNSYMVDLLLNDPYVEELRFAKTVNQRNVAARNLISQFEYDDVIWDTAYSFSFFIPQEELMFSRFNYTFPYADNLAMRAFFQEKIHSGTLELPGITWETITQGESLYLYQVYRVDNITLAAWVSCDALFFPIKANSLSPQGDIFYLSASQATKKEFPDHTVQFEISPEYTHVSLVITDEPYLDWGSFSLMICFVVFIFLVVLVVTIYTLRYYRRYIQQPLENFIHHVDEYSKHRQSVKRGGIRELNDALEAFDGLSQQIEKLRIDLYEEKLVLAQTEMEYLQLQIKPHFFVNCFSLIHAMAQKQEYKRIQSFCVKLSNYVRYLFSESLSLVPLERELSMVREFLDIQRIRHRVDSQLTEDITGTPEAWQVPPLALLTFVENALKHGGSKNIHIEIRVRLCQAEAKEWLQILVQDTGAGFPPSMLEKASQPEPGKSNTRHLGIFNISKRLQFLYGENFRLSFSNNSQGGLVTLLLPMEWQENTSGF